MIVLGLTGSLGMGKSTAARILRGMGIPVHDSDEAVGNLLRGPAIPAILARFPGVGTRQGGIDRKKLAARVFGNENERRALEAVIHPLVRAEQQKFLRHARKRRAKMAVLDIPLLYETGAQNRVDYVIVVTAPAFVQRQRARARGMTDAEFEARLAAQMPDAEKRGRADFVVQTGHGLAYTRKELQSIVRRLKDAAAK